MKILFIITQGEWGGAQKYLFDIISNWNRPEDKLVLAVGKIDGKKELQKQLIRNKEKGIRNKELEYLTNDQNNIKIIQLKYLIRNINPLQDILAVFELAKIYKQEKPNIIHLNSSKAGIIGSLAKTFNNLTIKPLNSLLIYTVHGWVFNEDIGKLKKWIYKFLEKITAKLKNKIIVLSKEDYDTAEKTLKINKNKLSLIPLGIEQIDFYDKKTAKDILKNLNLKINLNNYLIGTIANFYKNKGLDILIQSIYKLKETNTQFVFIGDGIEKNNILNLIKKYNLENKIILTGNISNASKLLNAFDLFVLPSRKEGLPYTILEAISANIPVISTKVGGIPSLIEDKKTGLLCEAGDVEDLGEKIKFAIENKEKMIAMSKLAQEKIKGYSIEKEIISLQALFQSLSEARKESYL